MIKYVKLYRVDVWEYERGWGGKLEHKKYFTTLAKAAKYVEQFNSVNTLQPVPDWYMVAKPPMEEFVEEKAVKKLCK